MAEEITCRICRGESTPEQPLLHPCKCRGSIKYIHQDCLMEWLSHQSRHDRKCDICNTPYRFCVIYDAEMPAQMPFGEVAKRVVTLAARVLLHFLCFFLFTVCIVQIPLFWKFITRLFTYALDGKPMAHVPARHIILYGAYTTRARSGALLTGDASAFDRFQIIFFDTYLPGLLQVSMFVLVLFVILIEHEWVVREEGYRNLLLRQIGHEPRTKLADLLTQMRQHNWEPNAVPERDGDGNGVENGEENGERNGNDPPIGDDNMHVLRERLAAAQQRDHIIGLDQFPNHVLPNAIAAGRVRDDDDDTSISDTSHDEADEANAAADDNEPPEELERRRNLAEDEMMAAEAANENILELLGFRFNLLTPLQLMMLVDFFVILFLFAAYLLPHSIGNMVFFVGVSVVMGAYRMAAMRLVEAADDLVLTRVRVLVRNGSSGLSAEPQSAWERAVYLGIGCFVICQAVRTYMRAMVAHEYPLTGSARRVYKMLFRVVVTAKVFAIFGIEIVVFPIYCGFLLDACLAPLFNTRFVSQSPAGTQYHLLFTTSQELALNVYWRVLHNWVAGTCYMFVIALFVSMVRTRIFRPGVLFFIKSPEEPNARLIHDAVVKPFAMQISRILLSAKVYLKLILGGIGAVTWALRLLVHSPFSAQEGAFLPIRLPTLTGYFALKLVVYSLVADRNRVAALCFRFWDASFAVLCHKLRLSHFVLDRPVPQERGYVVYRHALSRVFQLGALDYTLPVSYSEAQRMFRANPDVHACFVPDGSYIRAPSSDDNSRTFLKRMFVCVSKYDQLLSPGDPAPALDPADDPDTDWWDADIAFEDSYAVVYAPPHLRLRCFLLVCGVCLFAALLVVTVFVAAAAVGASIELATYKLVALTPLAWDARNFRYADALSILVGLRVLMYAVAAYERRPTLAEARRG
ncbi:hypothetical protein METBISCDRAFT_16650, partial [Metschnikowia bicuspidata]